MKRNILLVLVAFSLLSCASGYKLISPESLNYLGNASVDGVTIEYKYNLLAKKYAKKELKGGLKLVAVKLSNNSDRDFTIGSDVRFIYSDGSPVTLIQNETLFTQLKQRPASYLWYLLLTPVQFYTTETDSNGFERQTSSAPIGLGLGPGLTGANMIASGSANSKFKSELIKYNIMGKNLKKGETVHGLIGIRSNSFNAIHIEIK